MTPTRILAKFIGILALAVSFSASAATIHEVVRNGDVQAVTRLISENRNLVNSRNELGSTPLHIAASISAPDMVRLLIDKGATVNVKDSRGTTPLHVAAFTGHKENLELLLAKGADVHAKDNQGKTARDYADMVMSREISAILLIKMLAAPTPAARK
jgi:ankyrin repeat protein